MSWSAEPARRTLEAESSGLWVTWLSPPRAWPHVSHGQLCQVGFWEAGGGLPSPAGLKLVHPAPSVDLAYKRAQGVLKETDGEAESLPPGPSASSMSQSTAVPTGSHTRLGQSLLIDLKSSRESLHQLGGESVGLGTGAQTSRPVDGCGVTEG